MPMPIPLVEPVTMTTLSFNLVHIVFSFYSKDFISIEKIGLIGPPLTDSMQGESVIATKAVGDRGCYRSELDAGSVALGT